MVDYFGLGLLLSGLDELLNQPVAQLFVIRSQSVYDLGDGLFVLVHQFFQLVEVLLHFGGEFLLV